ncbi:late blight resistance homolog R1A-10 [Olea europaea subsp. europaea]|uniref:Late blight resistance homolog R1A-10 n=1 Tax=Olea europaea subsp. europaea TaxID=158383 RepID=A0A8S0SB86_OLEEU|nr:late blight resistance homolog R1A-10 [Olea europaea subsp. europaea]
MAYAAVLSLAQTLRQICFGLKNHSLYDRCDRINTLHKVDDIRKWLSESSQNSSEEVKSLEIKIRDMAYHAEDVIEVFQIGLQKRSDSRMEEDLITKIDTTVKNLHEVITEMESIMEEMKKIKGRSGKQNLPVHSSRSAPVGQTNMVGFAEDLIQIKDRLCNVQKSTRQTIPIVGMGGIGKTTLAMNVYNDPFIAYHFHICAWVTISQQYRIREILLSLLDDIGVLTDKIRKESDEQLKERIYKILKGQRYLIVMDDVWSTNTWNDIQMLFPDDNNGSRILLTTRLTDVADYVSSTNPHHLMHFLIEEESWNLLCQKVFREANCPPELVNVGRNISKNCQGLPLLIVVIAGLLAKDQSLDYWEYVAVNLSSITAENDDHCSKILTLSYNNLPTHLKPCFLYMGVFPENYEIPVSRLFKLWVAEGFASPFDAERYLKDLIGRNLILVGQKGFVKGKIKTCKMHDLLRELSVRIAHEENFLYVKSRYLRFPPEEASFKRRLSIHDDASYSGSEEDVTMQSMDLVRSFIYNGWDETHLHSYYYFGCRLLRVLDMVGVELSGFPEDILLLVKLRYIAIACHAAIPASITVLCNLYTLIVEDSTGIASQLPIEIWNLPRLKHLKFSRVFLPAPPPHDVFPLKNLQTLSVLDSLDYDIGKITPFLKKLGIHYNSQLSHSPNLFAGLQHLETLKILFDSPANTTIINIDLPLTLKKITLERGRIDWEYMRIFGSLPNLEVLKLREYAFQGREWIPNVGEFIQLKFLLIWETDLEHWRANETHFPRLEHLILRNCLNLVEIPSDIGEILTLETIEIDHSSPFAVDSAKKILEDQRSQGNDGLKVFVHPTKTKVYPLKFGIQQDESGGFYRRKTKLDEFKAKAKAGSSSKS